MMLARATSRYARHSTQRTGLLVRATASPLLATQTLRCQQQQQQQRSFLTNENHALTSYWMKRAKILQIVWRALVAYPQMHYITEPDAPISKLFARDSSARERAYMFVLSLVPPDEPLDLPTFLRGASDAVELVHKTLYDDAHKMEVLQSVATLECVEIWMRKPEQIRKLLGVKSHEKLELDAVTVKHAGASEVNYSFGDAKISTTDETQEEGAARPEATSRDSKKEPLEPPAETSGSATDDKAVDSDKENLDSRPYSKFLTHEAMQIKVKFAVREHLTIHDSATAASPRTAMVESTFEWAFDSDVSREELLDWVVTSATPFTCKVVENDDYVEDIASDIEDAA